MSITVEFKYQYIYFHTILYVCMEFMWILPVMYHMPQLNIQEAQVIDAYAA